MSMKIKYIVLCLLLALVGCQRDEEMEIGQVSVSSERLEASYSSVAISCTFQTNVTIKNVKAYVSTAQDFSSATSYLLTEKAKNTFGANIEGLKDASTYYVRYEISNRWSSKMVDDVSEFNTIPFTTPTVQTNEVTDVTYNSAIVGGTIKENGGQEIKECGIVYSKSPNPTIENGTKVESNITKEAYTCTLTNLDFATTYYARAYATNKKGIAYGEEVSFKTNGTTASLDTLSISDVTATSAVISGALINDGGESITALGICYGVNQSPTLEDATVINAELDGLKFSVLLNDLQKGTTYYVRAYATNSHGTVYSDELYFNTEMTIPAVTTAPATDISYTFATIGGNVTDDGGVEVTERGICYSTSANPTTANTKITSGSGLGQFICNLTYLQDGTTYYVRAYAINAKGTAYGEEVSFTTKIKTIATIATTPATNVSYTSATVGGNVTDNGGANVTERGICYSTSANPTTANTKITSASGLGQFTCNLTDLQDGTTYYVRAYAINEKGTAYGEEVSFTTKQLFTPTIVTTQPTNVAYNSATVGGNVTNDGGASVTERGICYSTSANPTTADTKVTNGSGLGEFTCNLTDLQDGTTYYVRAYAINAKGIAYGEEVSFTTKTKTIATIATTPATNVSYTSATVGGNVTDNGGATVTERGIYYSTSANPTTANTKITSDSGLGEFTCNLTDLQDGTIYYVRAYAINEKGTAYGEEVSFTTMMYEVPQITIVNPTIYTATTATIDCEVTFTGGLEVTERGVCYGITSNPTYSDDRAQCGSGLGVYSCELYNLSESTTYYVRAYAKNAEGIGYSKEVQFTTLSRNYIDAFEYVDLGLSVKWATCNVGANSPEEYGDYFAWGEIHPKTNYYWGTYKWCDGTANSLTKYNDDSNSGTVDNKTRLQLSDDAAYMNWGGVWRMPTEDEYIELCNECTWTWTTQNGVNGYKVTSRSNGNGIFLPAAGYFYGTSCSSVGSNGHYWISSIASSDSNNADVMSFTSRGVSKYVMSYRYYGHSVRPVRP